MVKSNLEAIGAYVPEREVTTAELMQQVAIDSPPDLGRISGVHARRVRDHEDSFIIATEAAKTALANSSYEAADLDVIISCSITRSNGDKFFFEPSFALAIRNEIGATNAIFFDVSNACAGMMTGVLLLDRMIKSGAVRRGMVVSGECLTPASDTAVREIKEKYDPQFASLTVGDGGAALILDQAEPGGPCVDYIELCTSAAYAKLCLGMPAEEGQGIVLYTDNRALHNVERYQLWPNHHKDFFEKTGSSFEDEGFDKIVHHQFSAPAAEMINALAESEFGAKMPPQLTVLEKYGNTASTSHFVTLHDAVVQGDVKKGDKIILLPAASGVVSGFLSISLGDLSA